MKKMILICTLAATMLFTLTACNQKSTSDQAVGSLEVQRLNNTENTAVTTVSDKSAETTLAAKETEKAVEAAAVTTVSDKTVIAVETTKVSDKSAETVPTIKASDVYEANIVENLLKKNNTVRYSQIDLLSGDIVYMTYFTNANGVVTVTSVNDGYSDYYTQNYDFTYEEGKSKFGISAMKEPMWNVDKNAFIPEDGEFISQTVDTNGNYVCVIETAIDEEYAEYLSHSWKAAVGDKMVSTITIAPDDLRILSIEYLIAYTDGTKTKIVTSVLNYEKEVTYSDKVQEYLDSEKVSVTVKFEDGGSRLFQIPKGSDFTYTCDEGYALYLNAADVNSYPDAVDGLDRNLVLYSLPKK